MNRPVIAPLVAGLVYMAAGSASAQAPPDATAPRERINGLAYQVLGLAGPESKGGQLLPVQAGNPSRSAWRATRAGNRRFLAAGSTPENVQVSREGSVAGASRQVTDFSEVMVAIDPTDDEHLLAASKFFWRPPNYDFYTGVFESHDGGRSWSQRQPEGVEQYSLTSDPVVAFDEVGNGYFTLLTRGPRAGMSGLDVLKKPGDAEWELPVVVDRTTVTDKQWMAGDQDRLARSPYAGHVYIAWVAVGGRNQAARIMFSRSPNRNASWSRPLEVARDGRLGSVQGPIVGTAPDGTVYVLYGRNIFNGPDSGRLEVVRSRNGGATFGPPRLVAGITSIPYFLPNGSPDINFRTPASLPAFAVGPSDGSLYAAWADYRHRDADIYLARSSNAGVSWSGVVRLNDDPVRNGVDQFQPQVSVAPNGRVAVMWFDRRLPCPELPWIAPEHVGQRNTCIDVFMTRSNDGGATWAPNIRVSEQTWDWRINLPVVPGSQRNGFATGFIGDYQGLASSDEFDYPVWNATANLGQNPHNRQQIFVARVPAAWHPPVATPTATPSPTVDVGRQTPSASPSATGTGGATVTATGTGAATVTATGTRTATEAATGSATATVTQPRATPSSTAPPPPSATATVAPSGTTRPPDTALPPPTVPTGGTATLGATIYLPATWGGEG